MGKFLLDTSDAIRGARIKVVGIGGAGGNAIKHMVDNKVEGAEFCCINTDLQDLDKQDVSVSCLQIGAEQTRGLGAGANPAVGRDAARTAEERISDFIADADMLFIAAGMGGGTGTGAAPVVASIAKKKGILTIATVTKPFSHENRHKVAEQGLVELISCVDTVIVVPNDKLIEVFGTEISLQQAFAEANNVLQGAVQGIIDLIVRPGVINVDFADVKSVMSGGGAAMMGTGIAEGRDRAKEATQQAIDSPLLEDMLPNTARGLLINVTSNDTIGVVEYDEICTLVRSRHATDDTQIVNGMAADKAIGDAIKVTVVATSVSFVPEKQLPSRPSLEGKGISHQNKVMAKPQVVPARVVQNAAPTPPPPTPPPPTPPSSTAPSPVAPSLTAPPMQVPSLSHSGAPENLETRKPEAGQLIPIEHHAEPEKTEMPRLGTNSQDGLKVAERTDMEWDENRKQPAFLRNQAS